MNSFKVNEKMLSHLEQMDLIIKDIVAGRFGGTHKTKSFGSSCEFGDYREYIPGDDIKKIDWSIFSRFEKLYLKLNLDERQMHTRIYLDASKSMDGEKGLMMLDFASIFAYLSIKAMDKVSIYFIQDDEIVELINGIIGKEAFLENIAKLQEISFQGDCQISKVIMSSKVGYGDGVSVIISDFLTDSNYENAIDHLRSKRRDVICLQVLSEEEMNPKLLGKYHYFDAEGGASYKKNITKDTLRTYQKALQYVTKRLEHFCYSRNAQYLLVSTGEKIEEILFSKFIRKEMMK